VRKLEKKLARRQQLTRVWEFPLDDGRKPLIFELADGSVWQLCDVGLGWTHYRTIGPDWVEHPGVKPLSARRYRAETRSRESLGLRVHFDKGSRPLGQTRAPEVHLPLGHKGLKG
jgi:hypothetical protein